MISSILAEKSLRKTKIFFPWGDEIESVDAT